MAMPVGVFHDNSNAPEIGEKDCGILISSRVV